MEHARLPRGGLAPSAAQLFRKAVRRAVLAESSPDTLTAHNQVEAIGVTARSRPPSPR